MGKFWLGVLVVVMAIVVPSWAKANPNADPWGTWLARSENVENPSNSRAEDNTSDVQYDDMVVRSDDDVTLEEKEGRAIDDSFPRVGAPVGPEGCGTSTCTPGNPSHTPSPIYSPTYPPTNPPTYSPTWPTPSPTHTPTPTPTPTPTHTPPPCHTCPPHTTCPTCPPPITCPTCPPPITCPTCPPPKPCHTCPPTPHPTCPPSTTPINNPTLPSVTYSNNCDFCDHDIYNLTCIPNAFTCAAKCAGDSKCTHFTYISNLSGGTCFLKRAFGSGGAWASSIPAPSPYVCGFIPKRAFNDILLNICVGLDVIIGIP